MSERFFSRKQREEHAEVVGHQCEWEVEKFQRCEETYVEADHLQPFSKGGKTELDNLIFLCLRHHASKHELDEEPYSAELIRKRMR